jgi:death on curing protein
MLPALRVPKHTFQTPSRDSPRAHPYRDGNKRIASLTMVVFLGLNGWDLDAPEAEVVSTMLALAAGRCSESELADWLRSHMARLP